MESVRNRSSQPLNSQCFYNGKYDDVLNYNSYEFNFTASTTSEITVYQSNDKSILLSSVIEYTNVGHILTYSNNLNSRYIYFQIKNIDVSTNQTNLNFTVLYKQPLVTLEVTNTTTQNVNVVNTLLQTNNNVLNTCIDSGTLNVIDSALNACIDVTHNHLNTNITNANLNAILCDSTGTPYTNSSTMPINGTVSCFDSYGGQFQVAPTSNSLQMAVFDGTGNGPINSTSNALNTYVTNTSIDTSDSVTQGYLNTIITNTTGLALDSSIQTLITQTLNNGGFFWQSETVNNNDMSHAVNLTQKNAIIYSYFGNVTPTSLTDVIVLTPYYSPDGITFYQSDVTFSPLSIGVSDFCSSQICGAGYVQLKITGLTDTCLVSAYLNHV